jgi:hypothetical protein
VAQSDPPRHATTDSRLGPSTRRPERRFRARGFGNRYGWPMRTMFTVYLLVVLTGLALYTAVGLAHL